MLKEFDSIDPMWQFALDAVLTEGHRCESRNGGSLELIGTAMRLKDIRANFILNPVRKLSPHYACGEFLWYLSMTNDPTMILAYAPRYVNFLNDGKAFGAYGHRWKNDPLFTDACMDLGDAVSQIHLALDLLEKTPTSRQVVVSQWNAADLVHAYEGSKKDLPCTLSLVFSARNGKLYLDTFMRSNDLWLGFPYDVFCFTTLQRIMADALGRGYGYYTHHAVSLHLYDRDAEKAVSAVRHILPGHYFNSGTYAQVHRHDLWRTVDKSLSFEHRIRNMINIGAPAPSKKELDERGYAAQSIFEGFCNNPITDAAIVCGSKFWPRLRGQVCSPLLMEGLANVPN